MPGQSGRDLSLAPTDRAPPAPLPGAGGCSAFKRHHGHPFVRLPPTLMIRGCRGTYFGATSPSLCRPPLTFGRYINCSPGHNRIHPPPVPFSSSAPLPPWPSRTPNLFWDRLSLEQKKEMAAIAAGRQAEADDGPMDDAVEDEPGPSSSPAPPSAVHCTMTIGEARAHYMDMVREEPEDMFREAHADAAYNLQLFRRSGSTPTRRSRRMRTWRSRRRCSSHTAPPARSASTDGGTASVRRNWRPPTRSWTRRRTRCGARSTTRRRTSPALPRRHDHEAGTSSGAAGSEEE